eukprot:TRINITY_DN11263_c0_g3_i2.p1 TRINITY_DN11263_c0_g3~~TRINITY_DN11263_c0_g3_i2.p1  ORF type:complete len:202 (+),score=32.74 TRINITY_DN11263_c0_g3_i2:614-1219(+)
MSLLATARRRPWKLTGNYLITVDHGNADKKTAGLIGKLRSNFWGSEYCVHDAGEDPLKCKDLARARENMGAVVYEQKWFGNKGPKSFEVLIPRVEKDARVSCVPTSDKDNLIALKNQGITDDITIMCNRKPKWNESIKGYVLNFHGKARIPSVKNFMLTDVEGSENYLILGKADDDVYNMDAKWPLSLYQAFCICISSIVN